MFTKILIANRGEIACRIMDSAQALGVYCIAVYSDVDARAKHVQMADEAHCIGEAPSSESYLKGAAIIELALQTGAQAIHPGYGFLSENSDFASACEKVGITFIGPSAASIIAMGSKSAAKAIMADAGIPLVPGYHGDEQDSATLQREALACGFPLLLKASAGGGGKGMRSVYAIEDFASALEGAKREARNAFGDDHMLLERYIQAPRHIEVQVFFDNHGNGIHLSQRDCSIQRRHQKIVEEAPAPGLSEAVANAMGQAAVAAAAAINYSGAGTVEFLYDSNGDFYFMEMNTRLQVEHPVTEMVCGIDLVQWQLQIAFGEELPLQQSEVKVHGHAIEVRVYAEDPANDFLPVTGHLAYLRQPLQTESVRVDSGILQGDEISVYYDPMLAKLIVWGEDRASAIKKMRAVLPQYRIGGLKNNLSFLQRILGHDGFYTANLSTHFIDQHPQLFEPQVDNAIALCAASCYQVLARRQSTNKVFGNHPFTQQPQWRLNQSAQEHLRWSIGERTQIDQIVLSHQDNSEQTTSDAQALPFVVQIDTDQLNISARLQGDHLYLTYRGRRIDCFCHAIGDVLYLFIEGEQIIMQQPSYQLEQEQHGQDGSLGAPMNGRIVANLVAVGDAVKAGDALVVMEAMKMEHTILAPMNGRITEIFYHEGDMVNEGHLLVELKENE